MYLSAVTPKINRKTLFTVKNVTMSWHELRFGSKPRHSSGVVSYNDAKNDSMPFLYFPLLTADRMMPCPAFPLCYWLKLRAQHRFSQRQSAENSDRTDFGMARCIIPTVVSSCKTTKCVHMIGLGMICTGSVGVIALLTISPLHSKAPPVVLHF